MVGRLKISKQAEAVRQFFMSCEKSAKQLQTCWFCGSPWPTTKLANQGYLRGNHMPDCPFEKLAVAAESCIITRSDDQHSKDSAEKALSEKINALLVMMTEEVVPNCPFPVCEYPFGLGHRLECPFNKLKNKSG